METNHAPDDGLGDLLTRSAPKLPDLPAERLAALSTQLAHEVVETDRGLRARVRGIRRRHRVAAGVASAAIVLVPSGAWAAQHFLAQTGRFGNPAVNPDFEDKSELINLCAKDFDGYLATIAPTDLPAPPGHSWPEYATAVARATSAGAECAETPEATTQESGLRLDLVTRAASDWGCVLVWADEDGDTATEAQARAAMEALNAEALRLAPDSGAAYPPDVFLANSKLPQWVGCAR